MYAAVLIRYSYQVEEQVQALVKKTDMFHILQVHLGYTKPYNATPARGCIIKSDQKDWLSLREIQDAFLEARLRLSEAHVRILVKSVKEFARGETADDSANKVFRRKFIFPQKMR